MIGASSSSSDGRRLVRFIQLIADAPMTQLPSQRIFNNFSRISQSFTSCAALFMQHIVSFFFCLSLLSFFSTPLSLSVSLFSASLSFLSSSSCSFRCRHLLICRSCAALDGASFSPRYSLSRMQTCYRVPLAMLDFAIHSATDSQSRAR